MTYQEATARAAARRSRRASHVQDNAALASPELSAALDSGAGRALAKAVGVRLRKEVSKNQIKAIKTRILSSGGLWSQVVRRRDKKCLMCGSVTTLQAHHWYFSRGRSVALSVDASNGATLCYGCHIGKIHREATGAYFLQLMDTMISILPPGEVYRMRDVAAAPQPLGIEFWQKAEQTLKTALEN